MEPKGIRDAGAGDGEALARIYNHYVTETIVTFEEVPVSSSEMTARIAAVQAAGLLWLVAEEDGEVVGYAYASPWKSRPGYRFSVEVTVYLAPGRERRAWGTRLYRELFERLAGLGVHFVAGGIALPNPASVALHEKMGMVKVAHYRENGIKFGRWIDVGYWQRLL